MIQQAIASDDPVIFFEPKRRYWEKAEVDDVADPEAPLPLHQRAGRARRAATSPWLAYGPMVQDRAGGRHGRRRGRRASSRSSTCARCRRWTWPRVRDVGARRPAGCVVVHEAPVFLGIGAEIAARVTEQCFYSLEAPVLRVGGFDTPYPPSRLEEEYLPDLDRVLDAVDRSLAY